MRIKPIRLSRLLSQADFWLAWQDRSHECGFSRSSERADLFEQLIVKSVGRHAEAVFANAAVSVVSGPMWTKGMVEMVLIDEVATNQERGWTEFHDEREIITWERQLAEVGPGRTRELAVTRGPKLLERTEEARRIVESVLSLLPPQAELGQLLMWLRERASDADQAEARRLSCSAGVMRLHDAEELYLVAGMALRTLSPVASDGIQADPMNNPQLMWQIQLLVDRLLRRAGVRSEGLDESGTKD